LQTIDANAELTRQSLLKHSMHVLEPFGDSDTSKSNLKQSAQ
jgi:hypothetical protein